MRPLVPILTIPLLAASSSPLAAQESAATYDVPRVAFPDSTAVTTLADLDGDGVKDALGWYFVDDTFDAVKVSGFSGAPDGTFAPSFTLQTSGNSSELIAWAIEAARFDADARDDFVCAFHDEVKAFRSDAAGQPIPFASFEEPGPIQSAVTLDVDGDGLDDLALAVVGVGLRIHRNTGTGFVLVGSLPGSGFLRRVDIDGDPLPELARQAGSQVALIDPTPGAVSVTQTLNHPYSAFDAPHLVAGDVDGDLDVDLVVFSEAKEEYVLFRRTGPATFAAVPSRPGGPATDLADVDGDGDLDGVCCGGSGGPTPERNTMPSTYRVTKNDGTGRFDVAEAIDGLGAFRLAGAEDVDGDGDVDLVAGRCVLFNRGFAQETTPAVSLNSDEWLIEPADRDGDGDVDLSRGFSAIWANDGAGGFAPFAPVLPPPPAGTIWKSPGYFGDFDGDGDVDAIAGVAWGQTFHGLRLLLNTGGGGFVDGGWAAAPGTAFGTTSGGFDAADTEWVSGDFDGDGDLDLAVGSAFGFHVVKIWANQGSGQFLPASQVASTYPAAAADLDGDGHLDLVCSRNVPQLTVAFGAGDGTFPATVHLASLFEATTDRLAAVDLDGDGDLEIALRDRSSPGRHLHVWTNQGGRTFALAPLEIGASSNQDPLRVLADDVDADGDVDLLVSAPHVGPDVVRILLGDGTGAFPTFVDQVVDARTLADVDGDGDLDAVGRTVARNATRHFPNDGRRLQFGAATAGDGGMAPTLGATGPFRVGDEIGLRLVGARGGSVALLLLGGAPGFEAGWPAPGLEAYVVPPFTAVVLPLGGLAGHPGTGAAILPPTTVPPSAAGARVTLQAFVHDPDAGPWLTQTNGLELRID